MNYYEEDHYPSYEGPYYPDAYDTDERQFFPFPPGGGSFPGFGPGGQPGFPGPSPFPGGGPGAGGGQGAAPSGPPPSFTPQQQQFQTFAVDPGAISGCLFRFTYVWLRRESFWFFPTFVGRRSVSGFRWTGSRWVFFGIDLNRIQSFQCF